MRHYYGSIFVAAFAIIVGFIIGGAPAALEVALLSVIEISMSFDNAVFNATILKNWPVSWQRLFILVGMPVAVFGMRFAIPIGIVSMLTSMDPASVLQMAIHHPEQYAAALRAGHDNVAAFGGVFLLMIAFEFFFDADKDTHWLSWIERPLTALGQFEAVQTGLAIAIVALASMYVPPAARAGFLLSGIFGIVGFVLVKAVGSLLAGDEDGDTTGNLIRAGIGGLLYLELVDASMSFDGVIGAFAVSQNIFLIMLGLGTGAMFVRSMTLHLVQSGVLTELRYIEHGAFWAILGLALLMIISVHVVIPDMLSAMYGVLVLVAAYASSWFANKRDASSVDLSTQTV